jgi:hypothetical protein
MNGFNLRKTLAAVFFCLLVGAQSVSSAELAVCVVDNRQKGNALYFGLALAKTRMVCDRAEGKQFSATLPELYRDGWEISQVVGEGWLGYKDDKSYRSPIYYMTKK